MRLMMTNSHVLSACACPAVRRSLAHAKSHRVLENGEVFSFLRKNQLPQNGHWIMAVMGREYSLAAYARAIVARRRGRAAGGTPVIHRLVATRTRRWSVSALRYPTAEYCNDLVRSCYLLFWKLVIANPSSLSVISDFTALQRSGSPYSES